MAYHIPIPVEVKVSMAGRNHGRFYVFPEAVYGPDGLEIIEWTVTDNDGDQRGRFDLLLTSVISRKVLHEVCRLTFENDDCPAINLDLEIGDEKRQYPMRAVETQNEMVEYEISIEGDWMPVTDAFVGDAVDEDFLRYAELEAKPQIDFGSSEAVYENMS